jgi:pyruvate formate lyase activating enzyme
MTTGLVFNIQKYSLHDGPGIRSTVFLKGCSLCCAWCHNPESISARQEIVVGDNRCVVCGECREACPFGEVIVGDGPLPPRNEECILCAACVEACPTGARQMIGQKMSPADVLTEVLKDRVFFDDSGGGVTISGGEPLVQPEFLRELLAAVRAEGIHTALDTCGFGRIEHLLAAAQFSNLILYDLKALDEDRHRRLTGVSNRLILENLRALDGVHDNIWIRIPIVPGHTDDAAELKGIARLVAKLKHVTQVNLLPFHHTASPKYERLGRSHALDGVSVPSIEAMQAAAQLFRAANLPVKVGG